MIKLIMCLLIAGNANVSDLNLVIKGVDDIKGSMYIAIFDNEAAFRILANNWWKRCSLSMQRLSIVPLKICPTMNMPLLSFMI